MHFLNILFGSDPYLSIPVSIKRQIGKLSNKQCLFLIYYLASYLAAVQLVAIFMGYLDHTLNTTFGSNKMITHLSLFYYMFVYGLVSLF